MIINCTPYLELLVNLIKLHNSERKSHAISSNNVNYPFPFYCITLNKLIIRIQ